MNPNELRPLRYYRMVAGKRVKYCMLLDAHLICVSDEPDTGEVVSPPPAAKPYTAETPLNSVPIHVQTTDVLKERGIQYKIENGSVILTSVPEREKRILTFFLKDQPCPFPGCESLRNQFFQEVADLGEDCADCQEGAVMRKYREIIEPLIPNDTLHSHSRPVGTPGFGRADES